MSLTILTGKTSLCLPVFHSILVNKSDKQLKEMMSTDENTFVGKKMTSTDRETTLLITVRMFKFN